MKALIVIYSTIIKEWKIAEGASTYLLRLFGDAMKGAALAWIVHLSGNTNYLTYVIIGIPFLAMWHGIIAVGGWGLTKELQGRTWEFTMISRASMGIVLFAQVLGQTLRELPSGVVALGSALLVSQQIPHITNAYLFPVSILLVLIGLTVTGYFFACLVVLVQGQSGFFMGLIPFGAVLSSLVLPVDQLPASLSLIAKGFPTTWAMKGVWMSINGNDSIWLIISNWGIFLIVAGIWFIGTYILTGVVENRVRVQGTTGGL
jgi:ABC-type multidrug transport system permease subunit